MSAATAEAARIRVTIEMPPELEGVVRAFAQHAEELYMDGAATGAFTLNLKCGAPGSIAANFVSGPRENYTIPTLPRPL